MLDKNWQFELEDFFKFTIRQILALYYILIITTQHELYHIF